MWVIFYIFFIFSKNPPRWIRGGGKTIFFKPLPKIQYKIEN